MMRAPKRPGYFWSPPDREWLKHHYVRLNKSAQQIAREVGTTGKTIAKWLRGVIWMLGRSTSKKGYVEAARATGLVGWYVS